MIYWTKSIGGTTIKYKAYKELGWRRDNHKDFAVLNTQSLAEVYIFYHKENTGSCMGQIGDGSLNHFESKEAAFEIISKQLK